MIGTKPAPFIVGVARSGTTLLRMMLDSHPQLSIPPETHFAGSVIKAFEPGGGGAGAAVGAIVNSSVWADYRIRKDDFVRAVEVAEPNEAGALLRLFYEAYAARFGKSRWGDKTPPYLDRMTAIQRVLPEAQFVHVIRDGRDVALSVIPLWFGPDDIEEAARHWSTRIESARRCADELNGYVEIRYEDLLADTPAVLKGICETLDLAWDPAMLDYCRRAIFRLEEIAHDTIWRDGTKIPAKARTEIHRLTTQTPRVDRIGRWRTQMTAADRAVFERIAGEMLVELGYELT